MDSLGDAGRVFGYVAGAPTIADQVAAKLLLAVPLPTHRVLLSVKEGGQPPAAVNPRTIQGDLAGVYTYRVIDYGSSLQVEVLRGQHNFTFCRELTSEKPENRRISHGNYSLLVTAERGIFTAEVSNSSALNTAKQLLGSWMPFVRDNDTTKLIVDTPGQGTVCVRKFERGALTRTSVINR